MKYSSSVTGYSLIEVLVAISILMLSIVGPLTIAVKSIQSAQYARQQNTAFFLAQEGISSMNTIRNDAAISAFISGTPDTWEWVDEAGLSPCFDSTGCDIDFRDESLINNVTDCSASASECTLQFDESFGRVVYQHVQGAETPFTRVITLEEVSSDEVLVTSRVRWESTLLSQNQEVVLTTSLFDLYE